MILSHPIFQIQPIEVEERYVIYILSMRLEYPTGNMICFNIVFTTMFSQIIHILSIFVKKKERKKTGVI